MQFPSFRTQALIAALAVSVTLVPQARAQSDTHAAPVLLADLPSAPAPVFDPQQQSSSQPQQQSPQQNSNEPSLSDLGFSQAQTQANPKLQALLNRRSHMLKIHQTLGLYTLIPMAATLITGPMAKVSDRYGRPLKEPTSANLNTHVALGGITGLMYGATAYYAIFAPRVPGEKHKGPIKFHEALAFIHVPGMIATGVLGAMAYKQESAGEKVHGAASFHGPVAAVTISAYAAAMLAVSWPPFHHHHS